MTYQTEDDAVDVDELNERMESFPQDILELNARKANLSSFKSVSDTQIWFRTNIIV